MVELQRAGEMNSLSHSPVYCASSLASSFPIVFLFDRQGIRGCGRFRIDPGTSPSSLEGLGGLRTSSNT